MADRFPIILNTSANQLQEIASGDTLDVSGAAIKTNLVDSLSVVGTGVSIVGVVTATSADINGDLDVDGHTNLDNVSIAGVVTATTINATTFAGALVGNSATATKLATARTIGGVSFDGTANINLPGVNASGNQDTSGNAATATALQNARTIGGVSFNGTANINLPGVNASGNQDTSGTAAVATNVTVSANNSTNETVYPVFVDGATGSQGAETDTGLTYNPSTGNLSATTFTGNLTGNTTGTIQTAAQPNITSVGTLSSLNVSGNVSIGGTLTYEDVTNIDSIGIVTARSGVVSPHADIDDFISVGSNIHLGNAGVVTATSFSGSGANLTSLPAGQLTGALPAISGANLTGISQVGGANSVRFNDDVKAFFGSSSSTDCEIVRNSNAVAGQTSLTVKSDLPFIVSTTNTSSIQFYVNNNSGNNGLIFDNNGLKPSSNNNVKLGSSSYKYNSLYVNNVFATTLFGDGSNLTGIDAGIPGISTTGISTFRDVQVGGAITCTGTIVNKIDPTTENSVIIGFEANLNNTNTDSCVIIGNRAGYQNATGQANNTFIGRYAGYAGGGTQGHSNTMIGSACGMFMYGGGSYNVAMGAEAGYFNNETYCVSIGANSGHSRGKYNVALGGYANGPGNTMNSSYMTYPNSNSSTQWGENNICIGYQSNTPNSDADNYIVIGNSKHTNFVVGTLGVEVTAGVTTHSGSVVVGAGVSVVGIVTAASFSGSGANLSGISISSDGNQNTVAGTNAGESFSTGNQNTFFGSRAGKNVNAGQYNTAMGHGALESATGGDFNIAIGIISQENANGNYNISMGYEALRSSTGSHNIAIGSQAGRSLGSAGYNTLIGYVAGYSLNNNGATENVAIGEQALNSSTAGSKNIVIGANAAKDRDLGSDNVVIGYESMRLSTGTQNVAVGHQAAENCTSNQNVAVGHQAMLTNTSGGGNLAVGRKALYTNQTGNYNTVVGYEAGYSLIQDKNTIMGRHAAYSLSTGSNNVILGHEACLSGSNNLTSGSNNIVIGYQAATSAASKSNEVTIGNSSIEKFRIPGLDFTITGSSGCQIFSNTDSSRIFIGNSGGNVHIYRENVLRFTAGSSGVEFFGTVESTGNIEPRGSSGSYDLGSSTYRWRNIYTNDLNLSNEGSTNSVDNTWGDYTIQEGESDLFLINNRSGKKYKFNLTEVS